MRGGRRVLTVRVLLELGKLGGAERDPPAIAHLRAAGPKRGATSHCARRVGLSAAGPGRPLGHIGTARGRGGLSAGWHHPAEPVGSKPQSFRAPSQHLPP